MENNQENFVWTNCYNVDTLTLTIPWFYNNSIDDLIKLINLDKTLEIKTIYFESSYVDNHISLYNRPVDNLSDSLECLFLSDSFNCSIDNLPKNLIQLAFGFNFNKSVDHLPENLQYLNFGYSFDLPIDNLPKKLKFLYFSGYFNQSIDKLPNSITHLALGYNFNRSIDILPNGLVELILSYNFSSKINYLPSTLQSLSLGFYFSDIIKKYPENLKELGFWIHSNITNIPDHVEILNIFTNELSKPSNLNIGSNVKKIYIDQKHKHLIKKIPWGCKIEDICIKI